MEDRLGTQSGSDEGEIFESDSEKATTSQPSVNGTNVDRHSRTRAPASRHADDGPTRSYRDYSPLPEEQPRGEKRPREDEYRQERQSDPRRFRVHYEGRFHEEERRSRMSYADLDYGDSSNPHLRYDEHDSDDRYDKRARTKSRSPGRSTRTGRRIRWGEEDSHDRRGPRFNDRARLNTERRRTRSRELSLSERRNGPNPVAPAARTEETQGNHSRPVPASSKEDLKMDGSNITLDGNSGETDSSIVEVEPIDEVTLIEERRKRREAIKAKYRGQAMPLLVQALQLDSTPASTSASTPTPEVSANRSPEPASPKLSGPSSPKDEAGILSPTGFAVSKDEDLANGAGDVINGANQDEPSAADYNPTMDMQEDQMRNDQRHHAEGDLSRAEVVEASQISAPRPDQAEGSKDDFDMFADEDGDDMFAEQPMKKPLMGDLSQGVKISKHKELDMSMLDDTNDPEGYYRVVLGEVLEGRYQVQANLGKGMFSSVVRASDSQTKRLVAIKMIRKNETMKKAGMKEIALLQKLAQADPEDKKHIIRLERFFDYKGHLCMVFENLSINLREVLKKFGRDVGINLRAVRAYAQQMFLGLSLLRKCNLLHADLKPDNILVNDSRNLLKICDLGSASDASDNEITPYLVSRFYRAPEIILGLPYDFAIDIWSIGCTLYELYTGKILFTGRTNNQMLRSIMECRGKFSHKMLRRAQFAPMHFDDLLNFKSVEKDKLTGKDIVKTLNIVRPTRDLKSRLLPAAKGMNEAEARELTLFADLLDRCLNLNPEKRCTPAEALKHAFISRVR